jgi:hypothetical protein
VERGSVEYVYNVRVRSYTVRWHTSISDGRLTLSTTIDGHIGPKGELYRVCLTIRADETHQHESVIVGTLTGYSHIGDRCRLVRRIAERTISRELAGVLAEIERRGRGLYANGDPHAIANLLIERICR